ncbi:MAG: glycosyltransferase [Pyrinomonadaceae bacterium]
MLTQREPNNGGPIQSYTIFAPGFAKWWGSDARALAQAFRRLGHTILDIDEEDYVPWRWQSVQSKVLRRLFGRVWVNDYNNAVINQAALSSYDFVLAYKGKLLRPETVARLRETGKPLFNFYPDVSYTDHGQYIPHTLQHYDCVFTTKSYHGEREAKQFGIRQLHHVRHGFDPEVHRPVSLSPELAKHYASDVTFVGCWSPEKEERLLYLLRESGGLCIRVFGIGWNHASSEFKQRMGPRLQRGVFGDELALVYGASKINLGLLSCASGDPTVRDQTTARTFQIPATNSLMLHEDTIEVRTFFKDAEEVLLFSSNEDMVQKVKTVLPNSELRKAISQKGYERSLSEPYDYSSAAKTILEYFKARVS